MPVSNTENSEDTKGVIRIRISKKNRQHNDQKKKDKRTNNDLIMEHIIFNERKMKIRIAYKYCKLKNQ
jgi:hypothetical protein